VQASLIQFVLQKTTVLVETGKLNDPRPTSSKNSNSGYGSTPVPLRCGEHVAAVWLNKEKDEP